jgi:uncharacterized coiled-coil protein SlyX
MSLNASTHTLHPRHANTNGSSGDRDLEAIFLNELRALNERVAQSARSSRPDLAEIRDLTNQIASTRRKLAAAQGEPPPHSD